jgi:hypothetical protein
VIGAEAEVEVDTDTETGLASCCKDDLVRRVVLVCKVWTAVATSARVLAFEADTKPDPDPDPDPFDLGVTFTLPGSCLIFMSSRCERPGSRSTSTSTSTIPYTRNLTHLPVSSTNVCNAHTSPPLVALEIECRIPVVPPVSAVEVWFRMT